MTKDYKRLSILLSILILFLCLASVQTFAQEKIKPKEFVVVKLIIKKEKYSQEINIPVSNNPFDIDGRTFIEGEFTAGGWATVGCINCALTSEYNIVAYAIPTSNNSVEVILSATFANKSGCNIRERRISIKKGDKFEVKSKCGVKLVAYL